MVLQQEEEQGDPPTGGIVLQLFSKSRILLQINSEGHHCRGLSYTSFVMPMFVGLEMEHCWNMDGMCGMGWKNGRWMEKRMEVPSCTAVSDPFSWSFHVNAARPLVFDLTSKAHTAKGQWKGPWRGSSCPPLTGCQYLGNLQPSLWQFADPYIFAA